METKEKLNLSMLCDFYELTMGNGYFETGMKDCICYFDVFFRKCPDASICGAYFFLRVQSDFFQENIRICVDCRGKRKGYFKHRRKRKRSDDLPVGMVPDLIYRFLPGKPVYHDKETES